MPNQPDLIAELEGVVELLETKAMLSREGEGAAADFYLIKYEQASAAFIHKHHAEIAAAVRDSQRIDWLADPANKIGNVQLPSECVMANLHSLRAAIDSAMRAGEGEG